MPSFQTVSDLYIVQLVVAIVALGMLLLVAMVMITKLGR